MDDIASFLLQLYRSARECDPEAFQGEVLDRLQSGFAFASAFWGAGRIGPGGIVPTWLYTHHVDPGLLPEWARMVQTDPLIPYLTSAPGRALPVQVAREFAAMPDVVDIAARYGIPSMTVISMPHSTQLPVRQSLEWLSLFREQPDSCCSDVERRWLDAVTPHLTEAWRINRALNADDRPIDDSSGPAVAVADGANGALLCADAAFRAVMVREWSGFDGHRLPLPLRQRWADRTGLFTHLTRHSRIDGRCAGELMYLSAQPKAGIHMLTPRQLEIAELCTRNLSAKQIAQRCGLSPATVRNHLATVYATLGVHSKLELAQRMRDRASEQ